MIFVVQVSLTGTSWAGARASLCAPECLLANSRVSWLDQLCGDRLK